MNTSCQLGNTTSLLEFLTAPFYCQVEGSAYKKVQLQVRPGMTKLTKTHLVLEVQTNSCRELWQSCQRMSKIIPWGVKKCYSEAAIWQTVLSITRGQPSVLEIIDAWSTHSSLPLSWNEIYLNWETRWKMCCSKIENTLRYSATLLLQCITINSSGSSLSFPTAEPISLARLIWFSSDSFRRIHYNLDKIPVTDWWNTDRCISATELKSKVDTN